MIDFHTHTLLSDGVLIASELVARAKARGYTAIAVTDHADFSNLEEIVTSTVRFANSMKQDQGISVVPGVELTHVPPAQIEGLVNDARKFGARVVVMHGETIVEPVAPGTNRAAIEAGVDILAHPGLVTEEDARVALEKGVYFEISARRGHCLTNGHVAATAKRIGVKLLVNTDAHAPGDLITDELARKVVVGATSDENIYEGIIRNAEELLKKVFSE